MHTYYFEKLQISCFFVIGKYNTYYRALKAAQISPYIRMLSLTFEAVVSSSDDFPVLMDMLIKSFLMEPNLSPTHVDWRPDRPRAHPRPLWHHYHCICHYYTPHHSYVLLVLLKWLKTFSYVSKSRGEKRENQEKLEKRKTLIKVQKTLVNRDQNHQNDQNHQSNRSPLQKSYWQDLQKAFFGFLELVSKFANVHCIYRNFDNFLVILYFPPPKFKY